MTTIFHARLHGRLIEIQSNLKKKKLHRTSKGSNFLGDKNFHLEPLEVVYKKRWNKANYLSRNSVRLNFVKKTSMANPVKSLGYISATVWVAPDLFKGLVILSDTTVRGSAVDQEDLKPYWKSEKRLHFSSWSTSLLFTSFSKDFTNHRKKTNRAVVFICRSFPKIFKYRDHR